MLRDTDGACVSIALALCLKTEKDRWTKDQYKWRSQHTHLMIDLRLSEPNDYKNFCVWRSIIWWATPTIAKINACEKQSLSVSVCPLRYAIWQLEMLLKTWNSCYISIHWRRDYCSAFRMQPNEYCAILSRLFNTPCQSNVIWLT